MSIVPSTGVTSLTATAGTPSVELIEGVATIVPSTVWVLSLGGRYYTSPMREDLLLILALFWDVEPEGELSC